jgi:integrating conjugative element protein (TIGR03746 family)
MNALADQRQSVRLLRGIIVLVALVGMFSTWLAWRTPKTIEVHLLPSVSAGDVVTVRGGRSDVPPQNVYAFAYYIWQQINRWASDGSTDYAAQIQAMASYVTPQCQAQLTADEQARNQVGELKYRTRSITEIPGFDYAPNRVVGGSNDASWTVFLDTQVRETFKGVAVKDVFIRYPIRVVPYDVDRQRNPWQLAIDCFGADLPARLAPDELHVIDPATRKTQIRVPALPGAIAPAELPRAVPLNAPDRSAASLPAIPASADALAGAAPASAASQ